MTELNKNILFQYFSGTESPLQKKLILEWLQDDANQETFYQWLEEWEKEHVQFMPDTAMASAKIMNKIDSLRGEAEEASVHSIVQKNSLFRIRKIWWVAASVVLVLGLSFYIFRDNINYIKYQTAYGQVKEFNLADGSHVVLNANSSLLVSRWKFEIGARDVILDGEAAFW
jgi:ferric-dicitrate binding protein FerR (iron transport regulator)